MPLAASDFNRGQEQHHAKAEAISLPQETSSNQAEHPRLEQAKRTTYESGSGTTESG